MMNNTEIIKKLQTGNERFVAGTPNNGPKDRTRRMELQGHQAPYVAILSCADSRVVPEWIFDVGLGELFVVRTAGNVAVSPAIASIEYSILYAGVRVVVVMGHEGCGAIAAALSGGSHSPHINNLLVEVEPAITMAKKTTRTDSDLFKEVVNCNASLHAQKLLSQSPIIKEAEATGKVTILAAYYELGSGRVEFIGAG